MQPEPVMDYGLLREHVCDRCHQHHRLAALPVDGGWCVGVRCGCTRNGHVVRYSTESETYSTFDAAEVAISWLLHTPHVTPTETYTDLKHIELVPNGRYRVRFCRNRKNLTVGHFGTVEEAVKARDEFLELEAA